MQGSVGGTCDRSCKLPRWQTKWTTWISPAKFRAVVESAAAEFVDHYKIYVDAPDPYTEEI